jgi:hypothetical protein
MKKVIIGTAAGAAGALAIAFFSFWPAKESNAQSTAPLPGQACTRMGAATICTFQFNDGVRCLYAGETGGKDESPSVSVSCTLGVRDNTIRPSAPTNPQAG